MKSQTRPFNAKAVGEVCIATGETGSGAVASLNQLCRFEEFCRIEGYVDRVKVFGAESALIPRIKEAIRQEWPRVSFIDTVNGLIVDGNVEREPAGRTPSPADFVGARKVAIVGVEGSGKTVMLAGLGALCSQPDANGCFLSPKNFETVSYVNRQMSALKGGNWPSATMEDVLQGLDWDLRQITGRGRPKKIGELSFLDFAGEVYRAAFVRKTNQDDALGDAVAQLKQYLLDADSVIVLVNLSDVIKYGPFSPRVEESLWITNAILDFVLPEEGVPGRKMPRAAIVLSQADSYRDTIEACGGPSGILRQYLPHVANNFGWLETFAVCTVDKTVLDDDGRLVPAPDFSTNGLAPIMEWVLKS